MIVLYIAKKNIFKFIIFKRSNTIRIDDFVRCVFIMNLMVLYIFLCSCKEQEVFTMHDMVHDVARSVMDEELVFFNDTKISSTTEQKFCHYALLENYSKSSNLSTILPATLRAVHTSNCSKLVLQGDEFSFTKFLRVLD